MPILYNWQTKKVEFVPDENVQSAVASGQYAFRKGARVPVLTPDGQAGTVDSSEAPSLLQQGWQFQTAAQARAETQQRIAEVNREAYDMPVTAALAGVARGATFGLSDVALRALGGEQVAEGLRQVKEVSPIASTVGEIAGAVGTMPFGATPVGAVSKLGTSISTGLKSAEAIKSLAQAGKAGEVAAKMLSAGAGSAIEGAFYGAGEVLSEAALGDPKLTAQNAAVTFGLNTLLGGATGGLMEGVGLGLSKLRDATRKIVVDDLSIPAKAGELYGKALTKLRILNKDDADEVAKLFAEQSRGWREQVMHYYDNPSALVETGTKQISSLADTAKFEADFLGSIRETRRTELAKIKMAKGVSPLNEVRDVTKAFDKVQKMIADDPTSYLGVSKKLETVMDDFKGAVSESKTLEDLNEVLLMTRQNIDARFKNLMNKNAKMRTYEEANTYDAIIDIRKEINTLLKDNKLFGTYAEKFAAADDAFNRYLSINKNFHKEFYSKRQGRTGEEFYLDETKVKRALLSAERNPAKNNALEDLADATRGLANVAADFADSPTLSQVVGRHIDETMGRIDNLKQVRSAQLLLSRLEPSTGKSLMGAALGYGAGEIVPTDLPGAGFAGAMIGTAFVNPKSALRILVKLERGNIAATQTIKPAVEKFLGLRAPSSVGDVVTGIRPVTINQLLQHLGDDDVDGPTDIDAIKTKMQKLSDPEYTDLILAKSNPGLDQIAPETYAGLAQNLQRAAEFVLSKAPIEAPGDLLAGKTRYSHSQQAALQSYAQAAFQPGVIFEELKKGRVKRETVETIATLYPDFYGEIQAAAIETLTEKKSSVRYDKKLQLAKLLGVPTTPALANYNLLQSAYAAEEAAPVTQSRMSPTTYASGPSDALLGRRG